MESEDNLHVADSQECIFDSLSNKNSQLIDEMNEFLASMASPGGAAASGNARKDEDGGPSGADEDEQGGGGRAEGEGHASGTRRSLGPIDEDGGDDQVDYCDGFEPMPGFGHDDDDSVLAMAR